jgi:hypothetical protein
MCDEFWMKYAGGAYLSTAVTPMTFGIMYQ